jgi:ABC-type branched-subunit amino acid transport system ATPase component
MSPNATPSSIETQAPPLLHLESVVVAFGGLRAVGGVDLDVALGERLAVLAAWAQS